MATDEEIRAKDVLPKLTEFRAGDGFYGDGQTSFFMDHQDVANNVVKDSANNTAATESDLVAASKIPIMTANGPKSLPGNALAKASEQASLSTYAQNVANGLAQEYDGTTGAVAGKFYMNEGTFYLCNENTSGDWDASKFSLASVDEILHNVITNLPPMFSKLSSYKAGQLVQNRGKTYVVRYNKPAGGWNASYFWEVPFYQLANKTSYYQIYAALSANLASLNDAEINTTYIVQKTSATTTTDFPSDYPSANVRSLLSTYKGLYSADYQKFQVLFCLDTMGLWFRVYNSANNTWSAWTSTGFAKSDSALFCWPEQIFDGNAFNLDNLNNAEPNTVYCIQRTSNTHTLNFPASYPVSDGGDGYLVTYKGTYSATAYSKYQLLWRVSTTGSTLTLYRRSYNSGNNTWSAWTTIELLDSVVEIGEGKQFTTLRAGFEEAYSNRTNAKVIVYPGTYDLTVEFADVLASITTDIGCKVGHGMHVVFADGAKVTANFVKGDLADDQWYKLRTYFAPIWARSGDFTIENMNIEATDCRYCVHDEKGNNTPPYLHKFINCKMKKTSTTSDRFWVQCIGGGLGSHGTIVVDGGVYEVVTPYGMTSFDDVAENSQCCISYHNDGYDPDAESSVTIKDAYLKNRGFVCVFNYGTTAKKTMLYVSGCSFGLPPAKTGANNTATIDNTELLEWNNKQRINGSWTNINNYQIDFVAT